MTKAREAKKIVQFVDTYSELYKDIFPEVRAYEAFKYLMVEMSSDIKRKSLPAIASSLELENEGWNVMTRIPEIKYKEVGKIYGIREWIESEFKQCKSELGWADFRVTHYKQIQKWWELVMCAYCMICLYEENLNPTGTE